MKTIMHPDYWVEIPAGECIVGMSMEQRESIWAWILKKANYSGRSPLSQKPMDAVVEKWRRGEYPKPDELTVFGLDATLIGLAGLRSCPPQQTSWIDRFYITRFPVTDDQFTMFRRKEVSSAWNLPGMLDTPEAVLRENGTFLYLRGKGPTAGAAQELCQQLGARFPTWDEWEKAARGTDGRLYPWGNEWNPNAGNFYREQERPNRGLYDQTPVNAHPEGVSPYGIWDMMGGFTEIKTYIFKGELKIGHYGWSPRDVSREAAPIQYLAANRGGSYEYDRPSALRPVLDQWPVQQWLGISMDEIKLSPTPSKRSPSDNISSQSE